MLSNQLQIAASQGRRKWLQEFLLLRLPILERDNADYQAWFDSLMQLMNSRGLVKPTQQKDYLSDVRNAIRVLDPNHLALSVVNFDKATWIEINNRNSDRIARRTTKFLDNPDVIVKRATVLLGSYVWSEIAAGLAVVTGRRCTEVIKTAKFKYKTKYSVMFAGSLKRKGEPVECIFEIPTLCEAERVMDAIASLREKLGGEIDKLSKRQASRRFGKAVSTQCERYFSELVPPRDDKDNLYTHLFRAVYATIASYWYCPPTVPEMEFRAAIQGHYQILDEKNPELRRSLAAGRNYFDYKISDGSGNVDGRLGIKLSLPGVSVIEQFKSYIAPLDPNQIPKASNIDRCARAVASTPKEKHQPRQSKSTPTTTSVQSKPRHYSQNQPTMNQANSKTKTTMAIPSFLHSRLEAISNQLGLSSTETIEELFKWAEVGISLANELGLEELNPNAVFDSVQSIKQASISGSNGQARLNRDDSAELAAARQQIASLIDSQLSMSRAMERLATAANSREVNSTGGNNFSSQTNRIKDTSNKPLSSTVRRKSTARNESVAIDEDAGTKSDEMQNKSRQLQVSSTATTRKRDSSDTVRKDINHAIDAIMEFNDAPERLHNQKFYIGVGSIKELSSRGDVAIRKILKEREEEIEKHLAKHELDQNQNLSRRDDEGSEYPKIYEEKGINYDKITEVA